MRHGREVLSLAFAPDGKSLVSTDGATLGLWEVPSGRQRGRMLQQAAYHNAVAFSADGKSLATINVTGSIIVRDFQAAPPELGSERIRFEPKVKTVNFLAFRPDGDLVAARRRTRNCVRAVP